MFLSERWGCGTLAYIRFASTRGLLNTKEYRWAQLFSDLIYTFVLAIEKKLRALFFFFDPVPYLASPRSAFGWNEIICFVKERFTSPDNQWFHTFKFLFLNSEGERGHVSFVKFGKIFELANYTDCFAYESSNCLFKVENQETQGCYYESICTPSL